MISKNIETIVNINIHTPYYIYKRNSEVSLSGEYELCSLDKSCTCLDELNDGNNKIIAEIPDSAHWSLYKAGVFPHPYYNMNIKKYDFVDEKVWYYKKNFTISETQSKSKFIILCFEGIDYYSRIFLNGIELCIHEGMFGGPYINVQGKLKEYNELIIEVKSANYGIKGTFKPRGHANVSVVRPWILGRDSTAPYFFPLGIWENVRLVFLSETHIDRPYIILNKIDGNKAFLLLKLELFIGKDSLEYTPHSYISISAPGQKLNKITNMNNTLKLKITITEKKTYKNVYICEKKLSEYNRDSYWATQEEGRYYITHEIILESPKLWYPLGLGNPDLYEITLTLCNDNNVADEITFDYGIKNIELIRSAGVQTQERFADWQYIINGRKVFIKGMNWMPADILLGMKKEDYHWLLDEVKNSGIQMLRVWGGGIIENDDFYDYCDKLGIMVWQEFPIGNCGTACFKQEVLEAQVLYNIYRLRNHASLTVWCGGNEFNPYAESNAASIGIIERSVQNYDGKKIFYRTSPDLGSMHTYPDMDPTWFQYIYKNIPFIAEIGMHSIFDTQNLRELINSEEFDKHFGNMQHEGFRDEHPEFIHHFTEFQKDRLPQMLSRASHINDLSSATIEDLAEATQIGTGEFYQYASEFAQLNYPVTTGILPWVFKRPWPTNAVQMIDGFGHPVAAYYYLKRTYENTHVMINLPQYIFGVGESIEIKPLIINSYSKLENSTVDVKIFNIEHKVYFKKTYPNINLSECELSVTSMSYEEFVVPEEYNDSFFGIMAELRIDEMLVSRSVYFPICLSKFNDKAFRDEYRDKPRSVIYFNEGPYLKKQFEKTQTVLAIEKTSVKHIYGDRYEIQLDIENTGDYPAYPVKVDICGIKRSVYLNDNYFWLEANEKKHLTLNLLVRENEKESIKNAEISASAWNCESKNIKCCIPGMDENIG